MCTDNATAPYNFVGLPKAVKISRDEKPTWDRFHKGRLTGYFDIEIDTLTPTFTRSSGNDTAFFNRGDLIPVMPGSSLRGMFRSIFEIITWSRLEFMDDEHLYYRGIAETKESGLKELYAETFGKHLNEEQNPRVVAGFLFGSRDNLMLKVSQRYARGFVLVGNDLKSEDERFTTKPCHVEITDEHEKYHQIRVGTIKGKVGQDKLIIPGSDVNRRRWAQVVLGPTEECPEFDEYPVPRDVYREYEDWGRRAHGRSFTAQGEPTVSTTGRRLTAQEKPPRYLRNGEPAFALLDEDRKTVVCICANLWMHIPYQTSTGTANPTLLAEPEELDMTQALFGHVKTAKEGDKVRPVRSRVFFEDAVCQTESPWLEGRSMPQARMPATLSGPKPTAFQMYLEQDGKKSNHWDNSPEIRGFKRYWHRSPEAAVENLSLSAPKENDKQNTQICPVRQGVKFVGRIRYENLTEKELGALIASIKLPEGMAHRFGMGKSLGLGSVKVTVSDTKIMGDAIARYSALASGSGFETDTETILARCYNSYAGSLIPRSEASIWKKEDGRLESLARLLYADDSRRQPDAATKYMPVDDTKRRWKDRALLPPSADVSGVKYTSPSDIYPVSAAAKPKAKPKPVPVPAFTRYVKGQKVNCTLVSKNGLGGEVRTPDGYIVPAQSVSMYRKDDPVKCIVMDTYADGRIKSVRKA
jgi:CRISPR-associated protein (TIGR03986 family)